MQPCEIVERLASGTIKMALMKRHITNVVCVVTACASQTNPPDKKINYLFCNDYCEWLVTGEVVEGEWKEPLSVACFVRKQSGERGEHIFLVVDKKRGAQSSVVVAFCNESFLQTIYENLSVLVEGMVREFPKIETIWKPLIDASFKRLPDSE